MRARTKICVLERNLSEATAPEGAWSGGSNMSAAIVLEGDDASWRQAHEALVRLATERAGLDSDEGLALLRARRSEAHVRLGFASFLEYTERLFGYGPRLTQEELRVAEALEELPEIAGELRTGVINFSVARVTRVAIPDSRLERHLLRLELSGEVLA